MRTSSVRTSPPPAGATANRRHGPSCRRPSPAPWRARTAPGAPLRPGCCGWRAGMPDERRVVRGVEPLVAATATIRLDPDLPSRTRYSFMYSFIQSRWVLFLATSTWSDPKTFSRLSLTNPLERGVDPLLLREPAEILGEALEVDNPRPDLAVSGEKPPDRRAVADLSEELVRPPPGHRLRPYLSLVALLLRCHPTTKSRLFRGRNRIKRWRRPTQPCST